MCKKEGGDRKWKKIWVIYNATARAFPFRTSVRHYLYQIDRVFSILEHSSLVQNISQWAQIEEAKAKTDVLKMPVRVKLGAFRVWQVYTLFDGTHWVLWIYSLMKSWVIAALSHYFLLYLHKKDESGTRQKAYLNLSMDRFWSHCEANYLHFLFIYNTDVFL